jgi:hypothetical protein
MFLLRIAELLALTRAAAALAADLHWLQSKLCKLRKRQT